MSHGQLVDIVMVLIAACAYSSGVRWVLALFFLRVLAKGARWYVRPKKTARMRNAQRADGMSNPSGWTKMTAI